jgi:hypothetical protein
MKRLCIYPKDIQIITGRSERYGGSLIQKMKEHFQKEAHQMITIQEFCQYLGLQEEAVTSQIH